MHSGLLEELCRINLQPWSIAIQKGFFYMSSNKEWGRDVGWSTKFNRRYWQRRRNFSGRVSQRDSRPPTIRNNPLSVNIRVLEIKKWSFLRSRNIPLSQFLTEEIRGKSSRICDRGPYASPLLSRSPPLFIDLPSNPILHCLVLFLLLCILVFYQQCYCWFPSLSARSIWVGRNEPLVKTRVKIDIANHRDLPIASDIGSLAKNTSQSHWTLLSVRSYD